MRIYDAIMAAADHIEAHPADFRFSSAVVPSCGTPGCAIGWIGAKLGSTYLWCGSDSTLSRMGLGDISEGGDFLFYDRMNNLAKGWCYSPALCASALRLYAEKYHNPKDAIPTSVRAIFQPNGVDA